MPNESYSTNPPSLDPGLRWFVPGLVYVHAGFPLSIFDSITAVQGMDPKVITLMMPTTLYVGKNFQLIQNNWSKTIQGVPLSRAMHFIAQLDVAGFNNKDKMWKIIPRVMKISDPLSPFRMVDVFYLLPKAKDHHLQIAGLAQGSTAVIEVVHDRS